MVAPAALLACCHKLSLTSYLVFMQVVCDVSLLLPNMCQPCHPIAILLTSPSYSTPSYAAKRLLQRRILHLKQPRHPSPGILLYWGPSSLMNLPTALLTHSHVNNLSHPSMHPIGLLIDCTHNMQYMQNAPNKPGNSALPLLHVASGC
jgi:hypothetical protein